MNGEIRLRKNSIPGPVAFNRPLRSMPSGLTELATWQSSPALLLFSVQRKMLYFARLPPILQLIFRVSPCCFLPTTLQPRRSILLLWKNLQLARKTTHGRLEDHLDDNAQVAFRSRAQG